MGSDGENFVARPIQVHTAVAREAAVRHRMQRVRSFLRPPAVVESLLDALKRILGAVLGASAESTVHPQPDHRHDPVGRDTDALVGLAVVGTVFVLLVRRAIRSR